jgi:multiple sugar transport system permease protein
MTVTKEKKIEKGLFSSKKKLFGLILVAPSVLILLVTTIYPTAYMFFVSFHRWSIIPTIPRRFLGLGQYIIMFKSNDFYKTLMITFIFILVVVLFELLIGLGLSLLILKSKVRWLRVVFFMPAVIASVVVGLIWKLMLSYDLGIINYLIKSIGLAGVNWLGAPVNALISVMLVDVWQWTPFAMLIILAGLESLPAEPIEAAQVDGASRFQVFKYILFPLLTPILTIVIMFRALDAFKTYDIIYMITRGGPANATDVLSYNIWRKAFFENNMGYAAALSVVMIILATLMTRVFIRIMAQTKKSI